MIHATSPVPLGGAPSPRARTTAPVSPPPAERRATLRRWLAPLAALGVLAGALALLADVLRHVRYGDVTHALRGLAPARLAAATALTVLAFAALPGYDAISLAYVGRRLPPARLAFSSCIAYGLSQTLGFPLLTGGAVRYRFWSAWGLSTVEITQAAGFVSATFAVGVMTICGAALLLEPHVTLAVLRVPPVAARTLGAALLAAVAAYAAWSATRRGRPLRVRGWAFRPPAPSLVLAQLAVGVVDWALAGAVLYVLVPPTAGLGFLAFLGVFVLAQFAGLVSHVPGGIGVFDTIMLLLLRPYVRPEQTLAVLLAYRAVYYLLPFAVALLALAAYEAQRRRARLVGAVSGTAALLARWTPAVLPTALGTTTFLAGAVLLFSGATPSVGGRVAALDRVLPLGVTELSHFAGSVAGAGLLVLAWALRRRLDAAWGLTVVLLVVGIVASLLKGLDWEEAAALAAVLAVVAPSRRAFYRKAAITSEPLAPRWAAAMLAVVGASVWLGLFSYKHVEYTHALWWQFTQRGDAPRFLRATAGAVAVLIAIALMRLLRHAEAEPALPDDETIERAHAIARRSPDTVANLALLGDKALLFSENGDGFLQHGVEGRSWVALGDPIGSPAARAELAWRFREEADRHGAWTVFYEVGTENIPLYLDLGLTLLKLGEEAHVPLASFTLDGGARKGLRRVVRDVERTGATFEIVPRDAVPALMPELRRVSDAWLADKATREKGFSLGRFDERYLSHFPMAVVRGADGAIVAFANLWTCETKDELSVDLMRFTPAAPAGVMDYLFVRVMQWGRDEGYREFNLGMAPLAGLERRPLASRWSRFGALVYRHGEHFYNFQGLRRYKSKFDPVWTPRYLASPGGLALPRVLANVTSLIAGGLAGVVRR